MELDITSGLVEREFLGGPMDGHKQVMEATRNVYHWGDEKGISKYEYWLDEDTGKMEFVAPENQTPSAKGRE